MSDESNVGQKPTIPLIDEVTGQQIGTITLEGELHYSRLLKANDDTYAMVDEKNWEIARQRFPGAMHYRLLSPDPRLPKTLTFTAQAQQDIHRFHGYPVIEMNDHLYAVPERHTEKLCEIFPQE